MKKNISINISGIIFHIEEDGYDTLKKYLDSINRYFSSFDDSTEILADIESRIAEIFLSKLNEGKQVITAEDVQALMVTMGSVKDFQAAEAETESTTSDSDAEDGQDKKRQTDREDSPPIELLRDQKRKILGGVCAGLAHYLKIDPVWTRLLFAFSLLAYGVTAIVYIVLWIVIPGSHSLEETKAIKKMFRDPENKVLAGVSQGIAAYFGIDVIIVRVLFIAFTVFAGTGALVYIILWIVLPEAVTITDRMKMQGEPVTLSNIESTVKKGLGVKEQAQEESALVKLLMFPFRILSYLIQGLGKIIPPIIDVLLVALGILVILMGFSIIVAIVVTAGAALGLIALGPPFAIDVPELYFPFEMLHEFAPLWFIISAFFVVFIPGILIILTGASFISRRSVINASLGWSLFALFLMSVLATTIGSVRIAYAFKKEADYEVEQVFPSNGRTMVFKLKHVGLEDYPGASLSLRGYHGKDLKLVERYESHGSSWQKAFENARAIQYTVAQRDSILVFDSNIHFSPDEQFHAQHVEMTLYIPYGTHFMMEEPMSLFINNYINYRYLNGYTWQYTESDGLTCVNCPADDV